MRFVKVDGFASVWLLIGGLTLSLIAFLFFSFNPSAFLSDTGVVFQWVFGRI